MGRAEAAQTAFLWASVVDGAFHKHQYDPAREGLIARTPMRRLGTVEDVAGLVAYLASDASGFLTGQTIILDGGLTIVSPLHRLTEGP